MSQMVPPIDNLLQNDILQRQAYRKLQRDLEEYFEMTRLHQVGQSGSDSDSEEEIHIKQYLNPAIKDGLIQPKAFQESLASAKAIHHLRTGVKRQPGHYKLRDCRHAVLESKCQSYEGNHWDVSVKSELHRSTPRLTQHAIQKAIEQERRLRSKQPVRERKRAVSVFTAINNQFQNQMELSKMRICALEKAEHNELELVKDSFQVELVREHNIHQADQDSEKERQNQIKLLQAMADSTKRSASIEDLVDGMTETNYKRSLINIDLQEASAKLEEDEKETTEDYHVAVGEMLDESLIKVTSMYDRDYLTQQAELSRKEKLQDLRKPMNYTRKKSLSDYNNVVHNLLQVYQKVQQAEKKEEEECRQHVMELKTCMQEELVRRMAKKWVDKVFAEEKARRIQEADEEMSKPNPARESMIRLMNRVQRQMLLQKFKGKWVNLVRKPQNVKNEEDMQSLSEVDKKLKDLRTRNRKATCVERGDED